MKVRDLMVEAARNVRLGVTRPVSWVSILLGLIAALIAADVASVGSQIQQSARYLAGGGATYVISASRAIDPTACDRLARIPGVPAAGAVGPSDEELAPSATPGRTVRVFDVSAGFGAVVGAPVITGFTIERQAKASFGLTVGRPVATRTGSVPIVGEFDFPDDGRKSLLQSSAIVPAPKRMVFDQCWMTIWPAEPSKRLLLYTALRPGVLPDIQVTVDAVNPRYGEDPAFFDQFTSRPSQWALLVAFGAACVFGLGTVRQRRLELASALYLGMTRLELVFMLAVESLITWAMLGALIAIGMGAWLLLDPAAGTIVRFALPIPSGAILGSLVGAAVGPILIRRSLLYRYFQER